MTAGVFAGRLGGLAIEIIGSTFEVFKAHPSRWLRRLRPWATCQEPAEKPEPWDPDPRSYL
jgi:hypothetical protein